MRADAQAPSIRLADYRPPAFLADSVELTFRLGARRNAGRAPESPSAATRPAPASRRSTSASTAAASKLVSAAIDGAPVPQNALAVDDEGLTVAAAHVPQTRFTWEAETEIAPEAQHRARGPLHVARHVLHPVRGAGLPQDHLLARPPRRDGDASASASRATRRSCSPTATSSAPAPAGPSGRTRSRSPPTSSRWSRATCVAVEDRFVTRSGRDVLLQIWVRPGDEDRCAYAMDALKRAMAWDEAAYGREYDLDRFMIVAVDDFNMGAMENKGLNVFNSQVRAGEPRDRHRRRLQVDRGDHRARVFPQLDRQPDHLPRLVPALR